VSEILAAFKNFDGIYKKEQIDAALELKGEVTPVLIEILENALAEPDQYIGNDDRYDHIYALMLLGHFKESKAHQVIVDLFSLPGDMPHELFGDLATRKYGPKKETQTGKSCKKKEPMLSGNWSSHE
jgi:hypothetical protein